MKSNKSKSLKKTLTMMKKNGKKSTTRALHRNQGHKHSNEKRQNSRHKPKLSLKLDSKFTT